MVNQVITKQLFQSSMETVFMFKVAVLRNSYYIYWHLSWNVNCEQRIWTVLRRALVNPRHTTEWTFVTRINLPWLIFSTVIYILRKCKMDMEPTNPQCYHQSFFESSFLLIHWYTNLYGKSGQKFLFVGKIPKFFKSLRCVHK